MSKNENHAVVPTTTNKEWEAARLIYESWDALINEFLMLTAQGKSHFEERKFKELFGLALKRYNLYKGVAKKTISDIESLMGEDLYHTKSWELIKHHYSLLTAHRYDKPNTETFYNSISRKIFNPRNVSFNQQFEFFNSEDYHFVEFTEPKVYREIPVHRLSENVIRDILTSLDFNVDWENLDRDCKLVMEELTPTIIFQKNNLFLDSIELLNTIFYRNRGAFIVGKLRYKRWVMPIVIAILNEENGLFIDAVITNVSDISILFSFTRASFLADTRKPVELIDYLKTIMPYKPMAELYDSIGYFRNGKTLLYRDLMNYLRNHDDKFIIAPGIKGMVMCVFTLSNYPFVFKIIKDKFDNPKNVTRQQVIKKYEEVELNDRVGRMAYAHLFEHLEFPISLFSEELLAELKLVATQTVTFEEDKLIISHCYMERKMTPLNLFLEKAGLVDTARAMIDYGNCIKELAAANIFPGDLLLKNFGVTRHGRVIFYDYDEISSVTDCNFRRLPEPDENNEMGGNEPSFSIAPSDVFPEEFKSFMVPDGPVGDLFLQEHADIFEPKFWRQIQRDINRGEYIRFFAYSEGKRLKIRKEQLVKE
jgi:isocitrate dehydrogenase kinase/phosphatase